MFKEFSRGNPAHTVSPLHTTPDDQLPVRLREHMRRLRLILPVISVSVMALRRQDAELDEDIASVLHHHACDPLDLEIQELETLVASLGARRKMDGAI